MTARTAANEAGAAPPSRPATGWMVFDYGEVISWHRDVRSELAAVLGVPVAPFCAAWAAERPAYDRGATDLAYWQAVGTRVGARVDRVTANRLTALDLSAWSRARPDVVALIADLFAAGIPLALLSNAPRSHARSLRKQAWSKYFRHLLFSGELGTAKPDPAIWRVVSARLGSGPADCLFLDDRPENVASARQAGLRAELWTETTADRLRHTALKDALRPARHVRTGTLYRRPDGQPTR